MQPDFYTNPNFVGAILILAIIDGILKGFALWRAARMNKIGWFIAILIINSAGIFPIIYLVATNKQYKAIRDALPPQAPVPPVR